MSQSANVRFIADFYAALSGAAPEAVAAAIDTHFAEHAAIEWPPSLPHCGRVEGSRRLRRQFTGIATASNQARATNLKLVRTIGDSDHGVGWITFEWKSLGSDDPIANTAPPPRLGHTNIVKENSNVT